MLRKIEGNRGRGRQKMRWLNSIADSMDMNLSPGDGEGQRGLACCSPQGCKELDTTWRPNDNNEYGILVKTECYGLGYVLYLLSKKILTF